MMDLNRIKLRPAVTFMKHLASVVSLILVVKTLTWTKIASPTSNSLNLTKLG